MPNLRSFCYLSHATRPMTEGDLQEILEDARAFNAEHGLTGFLLYRNGNFLQLIEGLPDAMDAALERIVASARHHQLFPLTDSMSSAALCPDWRMGWLLDNGEAGARALLADLRAHTLERATAQQREVLQIGLRFLDLDGSDDARQLLARP